MELIMMGMDFPHHKGEFCRKATPPYYTLCRFSTPFLYWKDGQLVRGEPGDFLINTPGQIVYHGPVPGAERGFVNDWMFVKGEDFDALLEAFPLPRNQAFQAGQGTGFRGVFSRLQGEFRATHPGQQTMIDCLITELMIGLYRSFVGDSLKSGTNPPLDAIRAAIRKEPEKKWTLAQMAALSGYSVSRFSQLYTQIYGIPPQNDVIRERMRMAKRLLASGQSTVTYVAQVCGFSSINYFSKYFKKLEGCTPTEYIRSVLWETE